MLKKLLLSLVVITSFAKAAEETQPVRFVYQDQNGKFHQIQRCFVDPEIRNIPIDKMEQVLNNMALRFVQLDDGEYVVHAHARGLGGLVLSSFAAGAAVRIVGYGGYGIFCFFQPHAAAEVFHVHELIEFAANAASIAAAATPAP